ncbi:MAG: NUDIX domain-containing protein [Oscillospiraceae bacterium]|jgi:8-oxo-dGTP pyrophosphatase MutT (NUDIX family)|nr:NUDIX domain-containing protein [Oscillospiraceae bacterium]
MPEMMDIYDKNKAPTGRVHTRGQPREDEDYVLGVQVFVRNSDGRFLITKRSGDKSGFPNLWEISGGGVLAGETSLEAILREFREETGFTLSPERGELLFTNTQLIPNRNGFIDTWLFSQSFDIAEFVPQEGETTAARWASADEILALHERGEFVPFSETGLAGWPDILRDRGLIP